MSLIHPTVVLDFSSQMQQQQQQQQQRPPSDSSDDQDDDGTSFIQQQQQQQQQQHHYGSELAKHLRESATFNLILRRIALMLIAIISLTLANALCLFTEAFNARSSDGPDSDTDDNTNTPNVTSLAEILVKLLQAPEPLDYPQ